MNEIPVLAVEVDRPAVVCIISPFKIKVRQEKGKRKKKINFMKRKTKSKMHKNIKIKLYKIYNSPMHIRNKLDFMK